MDPLSTRLPTIIIDLIDPEARMGTNGTPPVGLMGSGFPPVAFLRSIRKGIQHGRAGHARRKAAQEGQDPLDGATATAMQQGFRNAMPG